MDPPDSFAGERASPTRRELQGPRPTPLKVRKESHKIRKPPVAPAPSHPHMPPGAAAATTTQNRQPVIIYAVSPKVIHTNVSDFMNLVQRLTGSSSSVGDASTTSGDVSPAARLASIEKTSPSEREREREKATTDLMGMVEGVEVGQIPGILSPAPATLPPISSSFFSPGSEPHNLSFLHDLSPFLYGNNMFIPSPSTLLSAPMVSPSPSSFDLLNQFFNF